MKDKTSWFIKIWDEKNPQIVGVGECGPLPGLSMDARPDFEDWITATCEKIPRMLDHRLIRQLSEIIPPGFPAITFGMETALLDLIKWWKKNNF